MAMKPVKKSVKKKATKGKGKHLFKKGNCANPLGARAHNPMLRALRSISAKMLVEIVDDIITSPRYELERIFNDPETPAAKALIIRSVLDGIEAGSFEKLEQLLNRTIGPVSKKVDLSVGAAPGQVLEDKEKVKALLAELDNEY